MKNSSRFTIVPFLNPSGNKVYRVKGTLDGKSIRKNFKTRKEAIAFRQQLEITFLNQESEGQTIWTTLTHDQNRDAIAAVNMLKRSNSSKSLSFAVKYLLQHYKESNEHILVEDAVEEYKIQKGRELDRGLISRRQERAICYELDKFSTYFESQLVGEVRSKDIVIYLEQANSSEKAQSVKTWNNRRGYLSTFFKFCFSNNYVSENPILLVTQFKIKKSRGTAETLTAKQSRDLMHWLESYKGKQNKNGTWWGKPGCLVPYFALTLFAGIRPDYSDGEIKKLRPEDIRFDTNVIFIEPQVSKVNEKRTIEIQPNLRTWLEKYPTDDYPIIPQRIRDLLQDVRKQKKLPYDVMRHTFISMIVGAFRSVGDAALQAGNSETIIRKHYLNLKSPKEAKEFWSIVPIKK
jgi:integrase